MNKIQNEPKTEVYIRDLKLTGRDENRVTSTDMEVTEAFADAQKRIKNSEKNIFMRIITALQNLGKNREE